MADFFLKLALNLANATNRSNKFARMALRASVFWLKDYASSFMRRPGLYLVPRVTRLPS